MLRKVVWNAVYGVQPHSLHDHIVLILSSRSVLEKQCQARGGGQIGAPGYTPLDPSPLLFLHNAFDAALAMKSTPPLSPYGVFSGQVSP